MRRGQTGTTASLAGALLVLVIVLAGIGVAEAPQWIDPPAVNTTPTPNPQPLVLARPAAASQVAGLPPTLVAAEQLRATQVPSPLRTPEALRTPEPTPRLAQGLQVAAGPAASVVTVVLPPAPTTPTLVSQRVGEPPGVLGAPTAPPPTALPTSLLPPATPQPGPPTPEPTQASLRPGPTSPPPATPVPAMPVAVVRPELPRVAKPEPPTVTRPNPTKPAKLDSPKPVHKRNE